MESLTYHFLFNLSLMIALYYIFYISTEEFRKGTSHFPAILFYSSALVITFIFSYRLNDVFVIDMRFVPFLIGSLYHPISPILGFLTIIVRGFFGIDEGFYINVLSYSALSLIFWKGRPLFLKLKPYTKMIVTFSITTLYSFGILLVLHHSIPKDHWIDIWFATMTIPAISTLIITFLIELIHQNTQSERHLVKEERLKAIEQMGAAISHDIRNPLTTAIGFTELLSSNTIDEENRKQYISILREEIERAEQILQNYLNFSKPAKMSFSHVLVDEELKSIIQMILPLANYHSVKVETNLLSESMINVDRHKFKESMTATIRNAVLTIEQGGSLYITSSVSENRVLIKIGFHDTAKLVNNSAEKNFGEQSALLSAYQLLKAMKGTIEIKNSPIGYTVLLSFKRS